MYNKFIIRYEKIFRDQLWAVPEFFARKLKKNTSDLKNMSHITQFEASVLTTFYWFANFSKQHVLKGGFKSGFWKKYLLWNFWRNIQIILLDGSVSRELPFKYPAHKLKFSLTSVTNKTNWSYKKNDTAVSAHEDK